MSLFQKNSNKPLPGQSNDENAVQLALDIGSSKIRLIAGKISKDKTLQVLGYMETPSFGVNKGAVTDIALLSATIAELIRNFTERYKIAVNSFNCWGSKLLLQQKINRAMLQCNQER